jgi:hypothetical protein
MFWLSGAISLFAAALGIIDYVSRLVADVLRVGYLQDNAKWTESRLYVTVVWGSSPSAWPSCSRASTSPSRSWCSPRR